MRCTDPTPIAPGEHPLEWLTADQIASLQQMPPDTKILAVMVFAALDGPHGLTDLNETLR